MYDFTNVKKFIIHARLGSETFKNVPVFIPYKEDKPKQKQQTNLNQKRLVDTNNLMEILDCGKHTAIRIGTEAKARVCMERKLFWNVKLIQQYLDSISE